MTFIGDVSMATTVQDLKKGDELLFSYTDPTHSLMERNKFGFACRCRLCEWQRNDPNDGLRETLRTQIPQLYERKLNEWQNERATREATCEVTEATRKASMTKLIEKFEGLHADMAVMINQVSIGSGLGLG